MNKIKTISNKRKVGGDYFNLKFSRNSKLYLDFYLKQFKIEDYWIIKSTGNFRIVSIEDFLEFRYSYYLLFKKSIYKKEWIESWLFFIYNKLKITLNFLHKPFPPEYIKKLIKIRDGI